MSGTPDKHIDHSSCRCT